MPRLYEHVGYEKLFETEEDLQQSVRSFLDNATCSIKGYRYIYAQHQDNPIETDICIFPGEKHHEMKSVNIHCRGMAVWTVKVKIPLYLDYSDFATCVFSDRDGEGFFVGSVIVPDVLPRIDKDVIIRAQVIGFPTSIDFFADEEAANQDSNIRLLSEGMVLGVNCLGLLTNKDTTAKERNKLDSDDMQYKSNIVKAKIKKIVSVHEDTFYCLTLDTRYGDLPLFFPKELLDGHEPKIGEEVVADFFLSMDVAIYDRENAQFDDDSLYELFLDAVIQSGGTRLQYALDDNCKYHSDWADGKKTDFFNKKDIIRKMDEVIHARGDFHLNVYGTQAHISGLKDKTIPHKYNIGDRCILFSNDIRNGWDCAMFLTIEKQK